MLSAKPGTALVDGDGRRLGLLLFITWCPRSVISSVRLLSDWIQCSGCPVFSNGDLDFQRGLRELLTALSTELSNRAFHRGNQCALLSHRQQTWQHFHRKTIALEILFDHLGDLPWEHGWCCRSSCCPNCAVSSETTSHVARYCVISKSFRLLRGNVFLLSGAVDLALRRQCPENLCERLEIAAS